MHPNYILPINYPYSSVAKLARDTPAKCGQKINKSSLFIKRIITGWKASGQGDGGFLDGERPKFRLLSNRLKWHKSAHFLYLWAIVDKYELLKSCMQLIAFEVAVGNGADAV